MGTFLATYKTPEITNPYQYSSGDFGVFESLLGLITSHEFIIAASCFVAGVIIHLILVLKERKIF